MENFKGTKGKWEVIDHSWSDFSLYCGNKVLATKSFYDEATEDNQEELESEVSANFKLFSKSLDLLKKLDELATELEFHQVSLTKAKEARQLIQEATT